MLTLPPVFALLSAVKMAFALATPLLMGIAGTKLWKTRPFFSFWFLLAAALILAGFAGPLLISDDRLPSLMDALSLACSTGWFVAGLALVVLGFEHRTTHAQSS